MIPRGLSAVSDTVWLIRGKIRKQNLRQQKALLIMIEQLFEIKKPRIIFRIYIRTYSDAENFGKKLKKIEKKHFQVVFENR